MGADGASAHVGGAAFYGANRHNDVLLAQPESDAEREALVEELKRRGNHAFKARSLPEAEALYSRAIELNGSLAALYGNRSMTRAGMGRFDEALEDGDKAVEVDAAWAKGHFRRAKALLGLKRFDEAEEALRAVLKLEPGNTTAKRELDGVPKLREKHAAEEKLREAKAKELAKEKEERKIVSKKVVEVSKEAPPSAPAGDAKQTTKKPGAGAEDLSMRGYRTLADGRKTTYFNRELTEEERELLKDNAPKAVESAEEIRAREAKLQAEGASVWNSGGTFEEVAMTDWAVPRIKELLVGKSCEVSLTDSDGDVVQETIRVTDLVDFEGDASIAFARGKRRHIFDFNFNAKWSVSVDGKTMTGSLFFPDVSGDEVSGDPEDPLEFELRWSNRDKAGINQSALQRALVDDSAKGLAGQLFRALHQFAAEFRARKGKQG